MEAKGRGEEMNERKSNKKKEKEEGSTTYTI